MAHRRKILNFQGVIPLRKYHRRLVTILCRSFLTLQTILSFANPSVAQPLFSSPPKVDVEIELMSIVFRLAGSPEFSLPVSPKYLAEINNHFAQFSHHDAVNLAAKLRSESGVGAESVMELAILLGVPPTFDPIVQIKENVPGSVLGKSQMAEFSIALQKFYKEAGCGRFFLDHERMYRSAEMNFRAVAQRVDTVWIRNFYRGMPQARFSFILGLANGPKNYAMKISDAQGYEQTYSIVGASLVDSTGVPSWDEASLALILHELNHSFMNGFVASNVYAFEQPGNAILTLVGERLSKPTYRNWKTMLQESFVRVAVIRYFAGHGSSLDDVRKKIVAEQKNGFVWMDELNDLMSYYEEHRVEFPTLEAFLPRISDFHLKLASSISAKVSQFDAGK